MLLFRFILGPSPLEKILHHLRAFLLAHAAKHCSTVIQIGIRNNIKNGLRTASLHIGTAVDHCVDATVDYGAAAHGAGLHRYV